MYVLVLTCMQMLIVNYFANGQLALCENFKSEEFVPSISSAYVATEDKPAVCSCTSD